MRLKPASLEQAAALALGFTGAVIMCALAWLSAPDAPDRAAYAPHPQYCRCDSCVVTKGWDE